MLLVIDLKAGFLSLNQDLRSKKTKVFHLQNYYFRKRKIYGEYLNMVKILERNLCVC